MFTVADPSSILLVELSSKGNAASVAFWPDEERALMVGSDIRADFRVSGAGVAPVAAIAFHVERRDGTAWLVPAYELSDLRANAARVMGPLPLEERNVIEFGEVRVDIAVSDGGFGDTDENPASGEDAWSTRSFRSSAPPGEDDTTLVAMRAMARQTNAVNHQTTAILHPIHVAAPAPQQTERMAPYRPPSPPAAGPSPVQMTERLPPVRSTTSALSPSVTALGTEIMAPYRPSPSEDADAPPPTVRTGKQPVSIAAPAPHSMAKARAPAPTDLKTAVRLPGASASFSGSVELPPSSSPIVPVPVVPVTLSALAKVGRAPRPSTQTGTGDTTLFEIPVVRSEQPLADGRGPNIASTPDDALPVTPPEWSNAETHRATAKTPPPAAMLHSWLEKLGLLAKARPVLVAGGVAAGAFVLAAVLLLATRPTAHHETHSQPAEKSLTASSLEPHHAVPAPTALPEPVQIVEISSAPAASNASRIPPPPAVKKTPSDPALAAAVADVIAGRYGEARAAYAALTSRTDNAKSYAALTRLLERVEHAGCSGSGPVAPQDCPGIHR